MIARRNSEGPTAAEDICLIGAQASRTDLSTKATIVVDSMKVTEQGVVIALKAISTKAAATSGMSSKCTGALVKWVPKVTLPQVMVGQGT